MICGKKNYKLYLYNSNISQIVRIGFHLHINLIHYTFYVLLVHINRHFIPIDIECMETYNIEHFPLLYVSRFAHMNVKFIFLGKFWKMCFSNTNSTNFANFLEKLAKYHLMSQICEICCTFVKF
jgi:hypothetical protein